jgi:hypothetical protein
VEQGLQKLLKENEFNSEFSKMLLEVFMRVCRTLKVSDPADPLSNTIARTVFLIASDGVRDPDELCKQTLSRFQPNS